MLVIFVSGCDGGGRRQVLTDMGGHRFKHDGTQKTPKERAPICALCNTGFDMVKTLLNPCSVMKTLQGKVQKVCVKFVLNSRK